MAMHSSAFVLEKIRSRIERTSGERAQTTAEYAVILTLITAAVVLALGFLATSVGSRITDVASLF